MKLRIEITDGGDEVVIRCARIDDTVRKIQEYIRGLSVPQLVFYKGQQEFFLPLDEILFFETEVEQVYAHTANDAFLVKRRLYELETALPRSFVRAAKGTIVNTARIYAISRNLTASSQIRFGGTHKQVYVSRHYYRSLKNTMNERGITS